MSFLKKFFINVCAFFTFIIFCICLIVLYPFYFINNFEENSVRKGFYYISKFVMSVVKFISKSFTVEIKEPFCPGPAVIVANHGSVLDILAFGCLNLKDIIFLSRGWPTELPLLGKYLKAAGSLIMDSDTDFDKFCLKAKEKFNKDLKVVIFPEGTRSPDGTVGRFHKGAFALAGECGVPVIPVAIKGLSGTLRKNTFIVNGCDIKIVVMNKFMIKKNDIISDVAKNIKQIIAEELK